MSAISIETKKFGQLEQILTAPDTGLLLIHDGTGVKTIEVQKFKADLKTLIDSALADQNIPGAGAHNSIYRGKYLGTTYTAAQQAAVAAGTFDDLYIGDYWTIDGVNYRIAGFDYYLHCGDTECTTHHMIVVPDNNLYTHKMNDTNTTEDGYAESLMRTSGLEDAKTTVAAAFGADHILSHREYLTNAVTDGYPSACSWYDCTVELMSERMVYGQGIMMPAGDGTIIPNNRTVSKGQLPLFAFRHDLICNRATWWLRDIVSAAHFAFVFYGGNANYYAASIAFGVRPAIPVS